MYLKILRLVQNKNEIIKEVNFHLGINFVVDEEKSDLHNRAGKTTFLKLIDIALGAKDKAYLYIDAQTNNKNGELENLINNNKIYVELVLTPDLKKENSNNDITLRVDLYKRGYRYINGERISLTEYNKKLNEILFDNSENKPTFRELIPYFVRVSAKKDNYDFLKNLHPATKFTTYRAIYNYLFNISDTDSLLTLEKTKTQLDQYEKAEKNYRSLGNNDQKVDILTQKINTNKSRKRVLENRISDLVKGTDFLNNRKKITDARKKYIDMKSRLDDLNYRMQVISDDIQDTESKKINFNQNLTQELFNEVQSMLPEIHKTYEDLVSFNAALKNNKLKYLKKLRTDLEENINKQQEEIQHFLYENKDIISLVKNDDISKYDELTQELMEISQNITKQKEILRTLEDFSKKEKELNEKISELNESVKNNSEDFQTNFDKFNAYFTKLVLSINQGAPILAYHKNIKEFPVSIEDLNEGTSSGTLKSLILCYDIAYQEFAKEIHKTVPNFIVHDILESVSGDVLADLIDKINSLNIQVVVAILKEKLNSSKISQEDQDQFTILKLSKGNRVFDSALK